MVPYKNYLKSFLSCFVVGYYWRDFTGEIPSDALPGGTDISGKPIFIGQIFNLIFLIPAKIYVNDSKAYYEYGGLEHSTTDNIKVNTTESFFFDNPNIVF